MINGFLDQKCDKMDQKGLEINKKRKKIEFFDKKDLFSAEYFSRVGGYTPSPLTHIFCQKNNGIRAYPPSSTEKSAK